MDVAGCKGRARFCEAAGAAGRAGSRGGECGAWGADTWRGARQAGGRDAEAGAQSGGSAGAASGSGGQRNGRAQAGRGSALRRGRGGRLAGGCGVGRGRGARRRQLEGAVSGGEHRLELGQHVQDTAAKSRANRTDFHPSGGALRQPGRQVALGGGRRRPHGRHYSGLAAMERKKCGNRKYFLRWLGRRAPSPALPALRERGDAGAEMTWGDRARRKGAWISRCARNDGGGRWGDYGSQVRQAGQELTRAAMAA